MNKNNLPVNTFPLSKKARKRMRQAAIAELARQNNQTNQEGNLPVDGNSPTVTTGQPKWEATVSNPGVSSENSSIQLKQKWKNFKKKLNYTPGRNSFLKTKANPSVVKNIQKQPANTFITTEPTDKTKQEDNKTEANVGTIYIGYKGVFTRQKSGDDFTIDVGVNTNTDIVRPNLTVLAGKKPSVKTTGKGTKLPSQSSNMDPAPNQSAPNQSVPAQTPAVPKPVPQVQQSKQPALFQNRMTASSFMKPTGNSPQGVAAPASSASPCNMKYPAGIPKSFLLKQKHQQLVQAATNQPSTQGPVWEANLNYPMNGWNPVQRDTLDQSGQVFDQTRQIYDQISETFPVTGQGFDQSVHTNKYEEQMSVKTDEVGDEPKQQYSPSDPYSDLTVNPENEEAQDGSVSEDAQRSSLKRLSAFKRLGPVTQAKKPKLTINLLFNKEQAVRKVLDQTEEDPDSDKYTPVHLRADIQTSVDDTVMKYLLCWPWKKPVKPWRTATARQSKSVMMMELEQMEEAYDRDSMFTQVSVTGYPESWSKEDVLDAVMDSVKGKSFIPCFIEFGREECKFLVIRSRSSLVAIHKYGFIINKDEVTLTLSIMQMSLGVQQIDFIPRLVLRKRLLMAMEAETELNLSEFTTKSDVSHFIYFPLNRVSNQAELINLQSSVPWEALTKLDLSHNRITSLSGFDLPHYTPRLKHLDLSFNHIEGIAALLQCRNLPLVAIALEGNPLCTDYIQQERYIKVLKMIFPGLKEIDGVKLTIPGTFPKWVRNYSPPEATDIVSKVLEVLFPLLDCEPEERQRCEELYDVDAVMTITYMYKLRYGPIYKDFRTLFFRTRVMDEGEMEQVEGSAAIAKLMCRWPRLCHDPTTFTVDVVYHTETTTILKVGGLMRVTTESLAEDEHIMSFSRTIVMHSLDANEFKITNEMVYWDLPNIETTKDAFRMTTGRNTNMSLKLEAPPNEELKEKLLEIFMKLTEMERKPSLRCLETKEWHLRNALEYFSKLLKLDNLEPLLA